MIPTRFAKEFVLSNGFSLSPCSACVAEVRRLVIPAYLAFGETCLRDKSPPSRATVFYEMLHPWFTALYHRSIQLWLELSKRVQIELLHLELPPAGIHPASRPRSSPRNARRRRRRDSCTIRHIRRVLGGPRGPYAGTRAAAMGALNDWIAHATQASSQCSDVPPYFTSQIAFVSWLPHVARAFSYNEFLSNAIKMSAPLIILVLVILV